ncbi:MAG: PepSY domain-containing protein, partial [Pseudohongiellaceae bacterium]
PNKSAPFEGFAEREDDYPTDSAPGPPVQPARRTDYECGCADDLQDDTRPDGWLLWMIQMHFGRFRGLLWANVLWIVLGLLPAILYVSGFVLWYRRVLRVWWCRQDSGTP